MGLHGLLQGALYCYAINFHYLNVTLMTQDR
jgi:hypothetical protein